VGIVVADVFIATIAGVIIAVVAGIVVVEVITGIQAVGDTEMLESRWKTRLQQARLFYFY
jgi:hypothetical protein